MIFAVLPPASTSGVVIPCSANPFPVTVALETVTLREPEFSNFTVCELIVPMGTLPKLALAGVAVNADAPTPSPLSPIVVGEFVALLVTLALPVTIPTVFGANVTSTIAVCPGASTVPLFKPLVVIPAPLGVIPESVMLEVPVFFKATAKVCELPTVSFPKLKLAGVAVIVRVVATSPVPFTPIVHVLFAALLLNKTVPVTYPVTVGAYLNVKLFVLPPSSTSGVLIPSTANPFPLTVALEIVTLSGPEFFSSTVCDFVVPISTLPNGSFVGRVVKVFAATPYPLSWIVAGDFAALLVIVSLPGNSPAVLGANFSVILRLFPGPIVAGTFRPLTLKVLPVMVSFDRVTASCPSFEIVIEIVLLVPAAMLSKFAHVGLSTSVPWLAALLAVIPPNSIAANAMSTRIFRMCQRFSFCWEFVPRP